MVRLPLPFTEGGALLVSPRWAELPGYLQAGCWLLCLLPVALVVWLYRYELQLLRRALARSLLALRLLVVALLLSLVCWQPILSQTLTEELPGRVVLAVDHSESMTLADPQRPIVDKLRLARALRIARDVCPDAQLDDWIRQYETKNDLQWVAAHESRDAPQLRQRLLEERRRWHDEVCRRVDALTRGQIGQRVLAGDGVGLLDAVAAKHQIELLAFAHEVWDLKRETGDVVSSTQPPASGRMSTDLRLPLRRAQELSGPGQGRVLGVVVLTDGQHNEGPSPVQQALELGEHKVPIYPVALGARQAPPDVALARVQAPGRVFKDADVPVEARVKISGLPAQEVVVELQCPGQPPLEDRIVHDGSDRFYSVRFPVRLSQVGPHHLTVTARPVAGETRTDNNSRTTVVHVADDKAKVLLVDGEARWEYHYLANALARDRTIQAQSVVFAQPRLGKVAEDDLEKSGYPRLTLPADPEAFAAYDCLVVGDVSPGQLPLPERLRLEKYVADQGGTLVLVAGKRFLPMAFFQGAAAATDPLLKLLPLEEPRVVQPVSGFPITLTHEGQLTPFLQLDAAADRSARRWAELPGHFWGILGRAKPGAVALAYVADPQAAAGTKPGAQEKEQALLVRQNYGFGRVLFVGLESTWRWRFKVGDAHHHRFWGQVIRWAASDKPLVAGNEQVRFGTRAPVYRQGQEVEVVVRLGEAIEPRQPNLLAGARILRQAEDGKAEEAVALVPLTRREAQPRVLEGQVRDLPAGHYAIELAIPELADRLQAPAGPRDQPALLRAPFSVTPPDSEELVELATNGPLLEELAARSGGQVFTPETARQLVDLLVRQSVTRTHHSENKLWQWWGTLVVVLLLLTAEWGLRKWAGLP